MPDCPQAPPENREAVIAIQGGGVLALPMLGQVRQILAAGYVPFAFAGSSGGAILAALLWSGLSPDRIEQAFVDALENDPDALTALLLPLDPKKAARALSYADLERLSTLARSLAPLPTSAWALVVYLFKKLRLLRELAQPAETAWRQRGLFSGERLRAFIETLIREGLEIDTAQKAPITFKMAEKVAKPRRPPLLLTTTNVSKGRLELIDSTDPAYADVSIAAAVRASAGFPLFFEPIDVMGVGGGRCFADGGMVSNFPLWAFSRAFRTKLQQRPDYGWLAPRPWLPIGIRVVDEEPDDDDLQRPEKYIRQLAAVAAGRARNDIEDRLVGASLSHALIVRQKTSSLPLNPKTGMPLNVLDVDAVTKDNVRGIIATGDKAARESLAGRGRYTVFDADCGPAVLNELEALVRRCEHAMGGKPAEFRLRANIFFAVRGQLHLRFGVRMQGQSDADMTFPDLATGVVGWCYQTRSPAICNLRDVARAVTGFAYAEPFGMNPTLQSKINKDLSWLISYPIFDLRERQPLDMPVAAPVADTISVHRLQAEHIGPILGVLNVDAAWDYDAIELNRTPYWQSRDPRIVGVIDAVAQATLRLARLLVAISAEEEQ